MVDRLYLLLEVQERRMGVWPYRLGTTLYFSLFQLALFAAYSSGIALLVSSIEIIMPYFLLSVLCLRTISSINVNKTWRLLWFGSWGIYWINFLIQLFLKRQLGIYPDSLKSHMELYPIIMLMFLVFPIYMVYSSIWPSLKLYLNKRKTCHEESEI